MKIALYIDEDREQIVLTPESDHEKALLGKLRDGSRELRIHQGGFYRCHGGWTRHYEHQTDSAIIVLDKRPAEDGQP